MKNSLGGGGQIGVDERSKILESDHIMKAFLVQCNNSIQRPLVLFQIAIFMYKFHNIAAFHSFFTKVTSVHNYNTRFVAKHSYYLPYAKTNYGKFNNRFQGPSIWDTIDDNVKISYSISVFKKRLKDQYLETY